MPEVLPFNCDLIDFVQDFHNVLRWIEPRKF